MHKQIFKLQLFFAAGTLGTGQETGLWVNLLSN